MSADRFSGDVWPPLKRLATALRDPKNVARLVVAALLLTSILTASPSYWVGVVAAVALPMVFHRQASAFFLAAALVAQEVTIGPLVTTLGSQAYYQGKVPLLLILALSAAAVTAARLWRRGPVRVGAAAAIAAGSIVLLATIMIVVGLVNGQSVASAVNQNARPCVAVLAGMVLGLGLRLVPGESRRAVQVTLAMVVSLAVASTIAVAFGWPADARVSAYYVFYDAALPALAVAVLLALVLSSSAWNPWSLVVVAACLALVIFGFRRVVWLAAAVPIMAVLVLAPRRVRSGRRLLAAGGVLGMLLVASPGLAVDVWVRLGGTPPASAEARVQPGDSDQSGDPVQPVPSGDAKPTAVSGDVAAASSEGHLEDLRAGLALAVEHFWTGLGPQAPQPDVLASPTKPGSRIYVHNEWLLDWLRYGPSAVLAVTVFVGALIWLAAVILRRATGDDGNDENSGGLSIERAAAAFALITPGCLVFFPYLTTSTRWPLLIGLALGVMSARGPLLEAQAPRRLLAKTDELLGSRR